MASFHGVYTMRSQDKLRALILAFGPMLVQSNSEKDPVFRVCYFDKRKLRNTKFFSHFDIDEVIHMAFDFLVHDMTVDSVAIYDIDGSVKPAKWGHVTHQWNHI